MTIISFYCNIMIISAGTRQQFFLSQAGGPVPNLFTMGDKNMNMMRFFEQDKKLLIKVITGIILLVTAFSFYLIKEKSKDEDVTVSVIPKNVAESPQSLTDTAIAAEKSTIMVDVAGAVDNPSVVELPDGSRVFEAIEKAGGLTKNADTRATNQAEILTDGQKLYIPTKQELEESMPGTSSSNFVSQANAGRSGLININTADSEALQQLSGVGPATAEKIIDYRNKNGRFLTIEDIKNVSGIGEKTYEKFKDKITV